MSTSQQNFFFDELHSVFIITRFGGILFEALPVRSLLENKMTLNYDHS